jgi:threonine aldolase
MAYRELHHLEAILVGEPDRLFTIDDLAVVAQASSLLIELPQREIGGQLPTWQKLMAVCDDARSRGMKLHLDGARLWECRPFYGRSYAEIAEPFGSVYVSFYKILGGLPGAVLAGPNALIEKARVWQRRHGGNLVTLTPNAISAKLGLDHHLPRIAGYVAKAREIAEVLGGFDQIRVVPEKPPTNMMHIFFSGEPDRIAENAKRIAYEEKVFVFYGLGVEGKLELNVGDAALDIPKSEIERLFRQIVS